MSNAEAVRNLYGEISTERDGPMTHQCIQTNLADIICGEFYGTFERIFLNLDPFQAEQTTKFCSRGQQNDEVPHFQRPGV